MATKKHPHIHLSTAKKYHKNDGPAVEIITMLPENCQHNWEHQRETEATLFFKQRLKYTVCCHCHEIMEILSKSEKRPTMPELVGLVPELLFRRIMLPQLKGTSSEPITEPHVMNSIYWVFHRLMLTKQLPHSDGGKNNLLFVPPDLQNFMSMLAATVEKLEFKVYEFTEGAEMLLKSPTDLWPLMYDQDFSLNFAEQFRNCNLPTSNKSWYQSGKLHQEDGPAINFSIEYETEESEESQSA